MLRGCPACSEISVEVALQRRTDRIDELVDVRRGDGLEAHDVPSEHEPDDLGQDQRGPQSAASSRSIALATIGRVTVSTNSRYGNRSASDAATVRTSAIALSPRGPSARPTTNRTIRAPAPSVVSSSAGSTVRKSIGSSIAAAKSPLFEPKWCMTSAGSTPASEATHLIVVGL